MFAYSFGVPKAFAWEADPHKSKLYSETSYLPCATSQTKQNIANGCPEKVQSEIVLAPMHAREPQHLLDITRFLIQGVDK